MKLFRIKKLPVRCQPPRCQTDCSAGRARAKMRRRAGGHRGMIRGGVIAASATLAAGLSLAACTGGGGDLTAQGLLGLSHIQDASGIRTRELLPEERR